MNWYYSEDDVEAGPVDQTGFDTLVQAGKISAETKVWHDGLQDWTRYGDLQPIKGASAVAMPVPVVAVHRCAECGNTFPEVDMIAFENAWVCAACKPVFVQKLREGVAPVGVLHYAGFWIRVGAKLVDGIILQIINFCVGLAIGLALRGTSSASHASGAAGILAFLVGIGYITFFNGRFGATPGKMALKLKIVRPNGEPITYMRAFGRYFGEMLSGIILGIGFMMAGWDEQKRTLHDRICDTRVIRL